MNILFALDKYSYGGGGASRTAHQVVKALGAMGYTVTIFEHDGRHDFKDKDTAHVTIHRRKLPRIGDNTFKTIKHNNIWLGFLDEIVANTKPDIILTQGYLAPSAVQCAQQKGIKSVVFMHGLELFDPNFFVRQDPFTTEFNFWSAHLRQKLKYPFMKRVLNDYRHMLKTADVVVANSRFMQRLAQEKLGVEAQLLYPPIDIMADTYKVPQLNKESPILFVKPQAIKGVSVSYEVAKANQDRRFLVVGKAPSAFRSKLARLDNVETIDNVPGLAATYQKSAIILGPSLIPEPFGRVFVEAGFFGVPSVAFETGGIPESVGAGGILLPRTSSTEAWSQAIADVLNPSNYSRYSRAAFDNAQALAKTSQTGVSDIFSRLD